MGELLLPPSHPIESVDGIFVVAHDNSTNGGEAKELSAALQGLMSDKKVVFVHTEGTDENQNRNQLLDEMQMLYDQGCTNHLVIAGGGDGTLHYTGKALLHDDTPSYLSQAILTPWGLGWENDGFASLHTKRLKGLHLLMFHHPDGHVVTSNPLAVTGIVDGQEYQDWGLLYATFGGSAPATDMLGSKAHREYREQFPRWMGTYADIKHAAPLVLRGIPALKTLPSRDAPARQVSEIEFINSEYMGGRGTFARSTHLGDRAMHHAEIHSGTPLAVATFAGRIAMGWLPGTRTNQAVTVNFREGGMPGQLDGELIRDANKQPAIFTSLTVSPAPDNKTLRYYATKAA